MAGNNKFKRFIETDPRALTILAIPALVLFATFVLYPLILGLNISFTNWNGYSQKYSYVGFENYKDMFTSKTMWTAFRNTLAYGFGSTAIQTVLGLAFAMLLVDRFALRSPARMIIYLPAMVAQVVIGYIWYFIFTYNHGALNDVMHLFGHESVDWMAVGSRAVLIIVLVNSISYCGKTMIIFMAGLESVPDMYKEAASIDGANGWQAFRHITIPMLIPSFTTSLVLNVIGGLKMFGLVVSLSGGVPGYASHSLSSLINEMYFGTQRAGFASAIGMFTFIFIVIVNILLTKALAKWESSVNG